MARMGGRPQPARRAVRTGDRAATTSRLPLLDGATGSGHRCDGAPTAEPTTGTRARRSGRLGHQPAAEAGPPPASAAPPDGDRP